MRCFRLTLSNLHLFVQVQFLYFIFGPRIHRYSYSTDASETEKRITPLQETDYTQQTVFSTLAAGVSESER